MKTRARNTHNSELCNIHRNLKISSLDPTWLEAPKGRGRPRPSCPWVDVVWERFVTLIDNDKKWLYSQDYFEKIIQFSMIRFNKTM